MNLNIPKTLIILFLIIFVWIINLLFLNQAAKRGMNGHDWEYLFYYDSFEGNKLSNFDRLRSDLGNPYFLQISYYIGTLKHFLGLNSKAFKPVDIFWKTLAVLFSGWFIFKLTNDKIFVFFTIYFFTIFPSTAGSLNLTENGVNFLIIPFALLSIYCYIKSTKKPKFILLAGLFFYLSLIAGPARAYLLLPIPIVVELYRLIKNSGHLILY